KPGAVQPLVESNSFKQPEIQRRQTANRTLQKVSHSEAPGCRSLKALLKKMKPKKVKKTAPRCGK
ncbi:hypothetical protein, partial [Pseudomonas amygdali]|uniref:hypothetical protein n=1 Tax=Pseudomonas amygdali TaxID=47877 RepID=UPI001E53A90D